MTEESENDPDTRFVDIIDSDIVEVVGQYFSAGVWVQKQVFDKFIFGPAARKIPVDAQEMADSVLSFAADTAIALTAPPGKAKGAKQYLPYVRALELATSFVASHREASRLAYYKVVADHQDKIEERFGLEIGTLDKMVEQGKNVSEAVDTMVEKHKAKVLKLPSTKAMMAGAIKHFDALYGDSEDKPKPSLKYDTAEAYLLTNFLIANDMQDQVEKVASSERLASIEKGTFGLAKHHGIAYDNTMLVKGGALAAIGGLVVKGKTTAPEAVKGYALALAGAEMMFQRPAGGTIKNPIMENPNIDRRGVLGLLFRRGPKGLAADAIDHVLKQKEVPAAFQAVGALNFYDAVANLVIAMNQDRSRMGESYAKLGSWAAYALVGNVRIGMKQRNDAAADLAAGKDVPNERLGIR